MRYLLTGLTGTVGLLALVWALAGDPNGAVLEAGTAHATTSLRVGLLDPEDADYILAESDPSSADYGRFIVGATSVGMSWGDTGGAWVTNGNGTHTLTYNSSGRLDADAQLDPLFGRTFILSGRSTATTIDLSVTFSADFSSGSGTVTIGTESFSLSSPTVPHTADASLATVVASLAGGDYAGVWDALNRNFVAAVSQAEFEDALEQEVSSHGALNSVTVLHPMVYLGEPGPGYHVANSWVLYQFSDAGVEAKLPGAVSLILDGGDWKVLTIDPPILPTIISPSALNGWGFLQETATATGSFVSGPGTAPSGSGSAQIALGSTGGGLYGTLLFAGTRLDAIKAINYSTYQPSGNPGTVQTIALQFDMDYNLTDSTTSWQGRLVYEPYFTETVNKGSWQTWDPLQGKWWATGSPGNGSCPQSNPCTWAQVLSAFPNAGLRVSVGGLSFKAGSGWPANWQGNVDAFVIVVGDEAKAFDFEP